MTKGITPERERAILAAAAKVEQDFLAQRRAFDAAEAAVSQARTRMLDAIKTPERDIERAVVQYVEAAKSFGDAVRVYAGKRT